jgi:hypothetical protein
MLRQSMTYVEFRTEISLRTSYSGIKLFLCWLLQFYQMHGHVFTTYNTDFTSFAVSCFFARRFCIVKKYFCAPCTHGRRSISRPNRAELKQRIYFVSHLLSPLTTERDSFAKEVLKLTTFTWRSTKKGHSTDIQKYFDSLWECQKWGNTRTKTSKC